MKRENTNRIRFVLEELIPPIFRDSFIFKLLIKFLYRDDKTHQNLKSNITTLSEREYIKYYENMPQIHDHSDLSEICIREILKQIKKGDILDVGCGNGFLLKKIRKKFKNINLYGSEITVTKELKKNSSKNNFKLFKKKIENLNNINKKFDTVICSHVLEHVLDINLAYKNLKKLCKKKLIIIVPKERPYQHTFNGHLHFFPYTWSFINTIRPKNKFFIHELKRDLLFVEIIAN